MEKWWNLKRSEVAGIINSDTTQGITREEAAARLEKYGLNQLVEKKAKSPLALFIDQFKNFMIWVLVVAALVSGFLKEWVDAIAIIAIVILNAVLGFIQEFRAEKSLAALKKLSSPNSKVIRNGKLEVIPASEVVPGDLVEVEAGDFVPADCRIVYATGNLSAQEASLTGESTPVEKNTSRIDKEEVSLGDRTNMLYLGTSVVAGKGRGIVIGTGMDTELGRIAGMIQEIEKTSTPLQKKLEEFGKIIVYICFTIVAVIFLIGYLRGEELIDLFLSAVSLAVAAIPEGLPAVVTIALALGVQRMVKRHCLIRKLPSVETLGSTTVICSDKTGTLTKNEMTVRYVYVSGSTVEVTGIGYDPDGDFKIEGKKISNDRISGLNTLLTGSVLCNGAELSKDESGYRIIGDPTEGALLTLAAKGGITKKEKEKEFPFFEEIPFDSDRKKMTILRKSGEKMTAFVKGAPDLLIADCVRIDENGKTRPLTSEDHEKIAKVNHEMGNQAMRVLAIAYRDIDKLPEKRDAANIEKELTFLGLIAMIDPPRPEVKIAMKDCRTAGIKTVMITGDHKNTAVAIGRELGMFGDDSLAFTGDELDKIGEDDFREKVAKTAVYARVSPEHKLRIVKAWRDKGEVVAMTGDGVNDAPAVKEADIGVAMGITGTDVTKEVSEMVITDDNFASIVSGVEEGRGIYDNIRKFVHYLLSCNTGEVLVMLVASLLGWAIPLLPIQILWINLITDGAPALALGVDPIDRHVMKRPPRPKNESVITTKRGLIILLQGCFLALCSLFAFWFVLNFEGESIERARTETFVVLACSQLFHSFNLRNFRKSIFKIGFLTNKALLYAVLFSLALQMAVVYVPFLQTVFRTESLGLIDWAVAVAISSFPLWAMEIVKLFLKDDVKDTEA